MVCKRSRWPSLGVKLRRQGASSTRSWSCPVHSFVSFAFVSYGLLDAACRILVFVVQASQPTQAGAES